MPHANGVCVCKGKELRTLKHFLVSLSQVVGQRQRLPPVLNDKSLFTKAAPYGDREDQAYHAPSNRIGVNYSPASMAAASLLFEECPQVIWHVSLVVAFKCSAPLL